MVVRLMVGPLMVNCYVVGCRETKEAVVTDPSPISARARSRLGEDEKPHPPLGQGPVDERGLSQWFPGRAQVVGGCGGKPPEPPPAGLSLHITEWPGVD